MLQTHVKLCSYVTNPDGCRKWRQNYHDNIQSLQDAPLPAEQISFQASADFWLGEILNVSLKVMAEFYPKHFWIPFESPALSLFSLPLSLFSLPFTFLQHFCSIGDDAKEIRNFFTTLKPESDMSFCIITRNCDTLFQIVKSKSTHKSHFILAFSFPSCLIYILI